MKAMTLRLPDELAEVIERGARHKRRSIHAHILWLLEEGLRLKAMVEAMPRYILKDDGSVAPLDATGPSLGSAKGKASSNVRVTGSGPPRKLLDGVIKGSPPLGPTESAKGQPSSTVTEVTNRLVIVDGPVCTCGPGERGKGKHNKWCPMRGK